MKGFKLFFETTEEDKNIKNTLKKVPKKHAELIKKYTFEFLKGNTLKGDDQHIGLIDPFKKKITIAGPWNYGREFTLLHELAHKVWENFMDEKSKKEWSRLVKKVPKKERLDQDDEEMFCHAYANTYVQNKIVIHHHPDWEKFIKKLN